MTTVAKKEVTAHRVLTRKWREVDLLNHYTRITHSKPTVSCHNNTNFPHLITKPKKAKLSEGKYCHIVAKFEIFRPSDRDREKQPELI